MVSTTHVHATFREDRGRSAALAMVQIGQQFVIAARDGRADDAADAVGQMSRVLRVPSLTAAGRLMAIKAMVAAMNMTARNDRPIERVPKMVVHYVSEDADKQALENFARDLCSAATLRNCRRMGVELWALLDHLDRVIVPPRP